MSEWRIVTSSFAVMKSSPSSASAAEDMTHLMTWAIVNMSPFQGENGLLSARNICDPIWLQPLDSLWNPALEFAERTILLDM